MRYLAESKYKKLQTLLERAAPSSGFDNSSNATSPIPVAAQRLGTATSKVIETKQGARNKIEIRSPLCQATHVNEVPPPVLNNSFDANNAKGITDRLSSDEFSRLVGTEKLEWENSVQIVELRRDSDKKLGFEVKDYANPKDPQRTIIMIVSVKQGSTADLNGQLSVGDLLVFVDDTNLENSTLSEAVRALRRASGQVRLGIQKYKEQR